MALSHAGHAQAMADLQRASYDLAAARAAGDFPDIDSSYLPPGAA